MLTHIAFTASKILKACYRMKLDRWQSDPSKDSSAGGDRDVGNGCEECEKERSSECD